MSKFITILWHGREPNADATNAAPPIAAPPHAAPPSVETRNVQAREAGAVPIGICVFVSPPMSLGPRNRFFGRRGRWKSVDIKSMNRQLILLQRVVLHPTYRGAGIAADFIRRSCELCPFPWIETLTELGNSHPVFERAGFVRVGPVAKRDNQDRASHARIFGRRRADGSRTISNATFEKSRFGRPVYYVFNNRAE